MNRLNLSISGIAGQFKDVKYGGIDYRESKSLFSSVLIMIVVLFMISLPEGYAQTVRTWVPANGGVWTTPSNWSPSGIPVTGDEVIINTQTANIVSVPTISLLNLTINGNCTLVGIRRTITVTGTLTVADGAVFNLGTPASNYLRLTLAVGARGFIRGTGRVAINSSSTLGYFNVRGSLTIDADALVTGNQNFRMFSGSTLIIANPSGISLTGATGAIQVTGSRSFPNGSNYVYNGTAPQVTGSGLTQGTPANLTIDNSAGVKLSAPTVINKMLTISSGDLNMDSYYLTAGSLTGSGNITGTYGNLVLQIGGDNTSPAPYGGIISNGTATSISVTKVGTGTITFSGNNTYSGLTSINVGILKLGASGTATTSPLGNSASGTIVANGASFDLNGFTIEGNEELTLNGTGISSGGALTNTSPTAASFQGLINLTRASSIVATSGDINLTNPGSITGNYNLTLGGDANGSISSIIATGSGTISKTGTGTWTLSGANSFVGLVTINAGTLKLGASGDAVNTPLGTEDAGTIVNAGGVLDLNGFNLASNEALTLRGFGTGDGALINSSATAVTYNGLIRIGDPTGISAVAGDINIANPGRITGANLDLTLGGSGNGILSSILATNNGKLIKNGTGTWVISGVNTNSGGLDINEGTIQLGAANRLATQTVTLNGGTFSTGESIGFTETVGELVLTDNSFIALGTGVHRLNFSTSSSQTWTSNASLIITGWEGSLGASGTAGRIFFGSASDGLTAAQLAQIQFLINGNYYTAMILGTGQIVPATVISITTGSITGSPFCAGAPVTVPFTVSGTFTPGNVFTAQLSDASGSFNSPDTIGTSATVGSISATIPITAVSGTAYRIRVVSSTPPVTGSINGSDLSIIAAPLVTISPAGPQSLCTSGTGTELTVTDTYAGAPITSHQWGKRSVSGGPITPIPGETNLTYTPTIPSLGNGTWYVVCTSTPACGFGSVSNEVIVSIGSSGIWLGISADWNSPLNWCGGVLPAAGSDVFIPSNTPFQPVISDSPFATPVTCNTLTIGSGASLTLNAGQALTVIGNLSNSGTLYLKSDASGIASLKIDGTSPVTGTNNVELYLTGGGGPDAYKWHYISTPVINTSISDFDGNTLDLARYDEGLVTTSQDDGWIAADGYIYKDGSFGTGFSTLSPGRGYSYYFASDQTYTLTGTLNTNTVSVPLDYNKGGSGNPEIIGFNLIGNPFTCTLDWDVVAAYNGLPSAGISSAIYSTKDYYLFPAYVPGGPNPGTDGGTNTIPPMQAFFSEALAAGQTLTLPASAKTHSSAPRFKGTAKSGKFPVVRLLMEDGNSSRDAVLWFNDNATLAFDGSFDAYKLNKSLGPINIWTRLSNIDYAINGMTLPETSIEIPVGIHAESTGSYKLSSTEVSGLDNYSVVLKDKATNTTTDLKTGAKFSFSTSGGDIEDRFVIIITNNIITGNEEVVLPKNAFNIYAFNEMLNIQLLSDSWDGKKCVIKLTDISGRVYKIVKDAEFWKNSITQIPVPNARGIYIVEISSGISRYIGKVMIR